MFKSFYVHQHHNNKCDKRDNAPRGFTLSVQQDPNQARNVLVQGAWCSNKDNFSRKIGRDTAGKAEVKSINKRELPKLLAQMAHVCGFNEVVDHDFYYVWRYVI